MVKVVKLQRLQYRLHTLLAERPGLAAAFERALVDEDEQALAGAFEALHSAPNDLRLEVERAILDWLFGGEAVDAADGFAGYADVSSLLH